MRHDVRVIVLYSAALAAEVIGLALAAHGFRRTWLEFRRPDDQFFAPITETAKTKAREVYIRIRRLIGKPVPPITIEAQSALSSSSAVAVDLTLAWGYLPPVDEEPKAFMDALNRRLSDLNNRVQEAERRLHTEAEAAKTRHAETINEINEVREEYRGQVRTITVGGLREQVAGWLLIVTGVLAAGIGDIISTA